MNETVWIIVGFVGQACFTSRFLIQWLASERQKKSVIPTTFWYCSIMGGAILLTYAVYRKDPVFILGQSTGLIIYLRNLYFIHQEKCRNSSPLKTI